MSEVASVNISEIGVNSFPVYLGVPKTGVLGLLPTSSLFPSNTGTTQESLISSTKIEWASVPPTGEQEAQVIRKAHHLFRRYDVWGPNPDEAPYSRGDFVLMATGINTCSETTMCGYSIERGNGAYNDRVHAFELNPNLENLLQSAGFPISDHRQALEIGRFMGLEGITPQEMGNNIAIMAKILDYKIRGENQNRISNDIPRIGFVMAMMKPALARVVNSKLPSFQEISLSSIGNPNSAPVMSMFDRNSEDTKKLFLMRPFYFLETDSTLWNILGDCPTQFKSWHYLLHTVKKSTNLAQLNEIYIQHIYPRIEYHFKEICDRVPDAVKLFVASVDELRNDLQKV